jgi:hypothetical protein
MDDQWSEHHSFVKEIVLLAYCHVLWGVAIRRGLDWMIGTLLLISTKQITRTRYVISIFTSRVLATDL